MSSQHPFGAQLTQLRLRKTGLSQTRLAELSGYAPAILVRMCQGKKDLTGPSGRDRIIRLLETLRAEGVRFTEHEVNALLSTAGFPPLYEGIPAEALLIQHLRDAASIGSVLSPATDVPQTNLLPALTTFIGRVTEINALSQRVRTERHITLIGAGGVGKTRLACEVGASLVSTFADGVWLVELAALTDPNGVADAVAQVFGLSASDVLAALFRHLRSQHMLVILDNCEHLIEACAALTLQLRQRCLHVHILCTSREALRVPGEFVWMVPPLNMPEGTHEPVSVLLQSEAVQLFVERAYSLHRYFEANDQNVPIIAKICRRLEGIPLALELAVGLIQGMHVEEIAKNLDTFLALPNPIRQGGIPRHQTMQRALDWSFALLSERQQKMLANLSVFTGGCTLEAAAAVCAVELSEATHNILSLVQKSLVIVDASVPETRYRLLEPVRQYAAGKLIQSGNWLALQQRLLRYFAEYATRADFGLMGASHGAWLTRVLAEMPNFRALRMYCRQSAADRNDELCMVGSLWRIWVTRLPVRDGQTWIEEVLARSEDCVIDPAIKAKAYYGLAWMYRYIRVFARMTELARKALTICQQSGDLLGMASCLPLLAIQARLEFDYDKEERLHLEGFRLLSTTPAVLSANDALIELCWMKVDRRLYAEAEELACKYMAACEALNDLNGVWTALWWRALIAIRRRDMVTAAPLLERAFAIAGPSGLQEFTARTIELWGLIDLPKALMMAKVDVQKRRVSGDRRGLALLLHALGRLQTQSGDYSAAQMSLAESIEIWAEGEPDWIEWGGAGWAWLELGDIALVQGNLSLAHEHYIRGQRVHEEVRAFDNVAAAQLRLGYLAHLLGQGALAKEHLHTSLLGYYHSGVREGIAIVLVCLAKIEIKDRRATNLAHLKGLISNQLHVDELLSMRLVEQNLFQEVRRAIDQCFEEVGFTGNDWEPRRNDIFEAMRMGKQLLDRQPPTGFD